VSHAGYLVNKAIPKTITSAVIQVNGKAYNLTDKLQQKTPIPFAVDGPTPAATYTWNFGDGAADSLDSRSNPTHQYQTAGSYDVYVMVKDPTGISIGQETIQITV